MPEQVSVAKKQQICCKKATNPAGKGNLGAKLLILLELIDCKTGSG